jgi:hypothetical protein
MPCPQAQLIVLLERLEGMGRAAAVAERRKPLRLRVRPWNRRGVKTTPETVVCRPPRRSRVPAKANLF